MKQIQLTQGKVSLVDDEDYDLLKKYKWTALKHRGTFYARCNNKKNPLKMHRVIMGATDPNDIIDHRDCDGLNNQKSNLRRCTNAQNQANRPKRKFSIGKYKGIALAPTKRKERWRAQIKKEGKVIGLGYFDSQEEAARAYDKAALEIHGEFANLNFKI